MEIESSRKGFMYFLRVGDGYLIIGKALGRIIMRNLNLSTKKIK